VTSQSKICDDTPANIAIAIYVCTVHTVQKMNSVTTISTNVLLLCITSQCHYLYYCWVHSVIQSNYTYRWL